MKHIIKINAFILIFSLQNTLCMYLNTWNMLSKFNKILYLHNKIKKEQNIQNARKKKYFNQHDFDDTKATQNSFRYDINRELR